MQKILAPEQLEAFYHNLFVELQVQHFIALFGEPGHAKMVVDVGGGCGFFAKALMAKGDFNVRVLDMDQKSIDACHIAGIVGLKSDALQPDISGDENIASFNLILHHLVGRSERDTREMQMKALAVWAQHIQAIFVNEYIYESYFHDVSGWLIYMITKSPMLSYVGRLISTVVPSLKANTFGVGVRFRSNQNWQRLFKSAGYEVRATVFGDEEHVSLPRRLLFIKQIRRDSFLLIPRGIK